jgi:hypothetical protein
VIASVGISYKTQTMPPDTLVALVNSCQISMAKDVCGVMKISPPQSGQSRLFISGIGEVNAQAFNQPKAAGNAICKEVETQCKTQWDGKSCRIARSLYPI